MRSDKYKENINLTRAHVAKPGAGLARDGPEEKHARETRASR
jgi:hypothetical protein